MTRAATTKGAAGPDQCPLGARPSAAPARVAVSSGASDSVRRSPQLDVHNGSIADRPTAIPQRGLPR